MTTSSVVLSGYNSLDRAASLLKPAHLSRADREDSHPLSQSRSSIRYETVASLWIRRLHKFLCFLVDSNSRCPTFFAVSVPHSYVRISRLPANRTKRAEFRISFDAESECHVAVTFGDGFDVVRHALDRRARDEIPGTDLPRHGAGPADPDGNIRGLHGCQQIFQRRQIHPRHMIRSSFAPERHGFIPEPEHDLVPLLLHNIRCHERRCCHRGIVRAPDTRNNKCRHRVTLLRS